MRRRFGLATAAARKKQDILYDDNLVQSMPNRRAKQRTVQARLAERDDLELQIAELDDQKRRLQGMWSSTRRDLQTFGFDRGSGYYKRPVQRGQYTAAPDRDPRRGHTRGQSVQNRNGGAPQSTANNKGTSPTERVAQTANTPPWVCGSCACTVRGSLVYCTGCRRHKSKCIVPATAPLVQAAPVAARTFAEVARQQPAGVAVVRLFVDPTPAVALVQLVAVVGPPPLEDDGTLTVAEDQLAAEEAQPRNIRTAINKLTRKVAGTEKRIKRKEEDIDAKMQEIERLNEELRQLEAEKATEEVILKRKPRGS